MIGSYSAAYLDKTCGLFYPRTVTIPARGPVRDAKDGLDAAVPAVGQ